MSRLPLLLFLMLCCGVCQSVWAQTPLQPLTGNRVVCADGMASAFPCGSVDLMGYLPLQALGGTARLNDIWGWTDPVSGKEYALVGQLEGTAFVDVSNPVDPIFLGTLPLTEGAFPNVWRDVKVYNNHAFIVADGAGDHGMQIFDLTQLRDVTEAPVTFAETAHYGGFDSAHNLVINEATGFAYGVGITGAQMVPAGVACGPGYHIVDINDPVNPTFAGCFFDPATGSGGRGYTHDAQCVVYHGPDVAHQGKELCFGANETAISIADVTDKSDPVAVAQATYPGVGYAHQGWLTEDHRYFLLDDELDELRGEVPGTRTLIWDVTDLDDPQLLHEYFGTTGSVDHNLYVVDDFVFQANYTSGLRILDISDIEQPREVAFFDTVPGSDALGFDGAWSVYPFFESGVVVVSSIHQGLFVLQPTRLRVGTAMEAAEVPSPFVLSAAYPNPFNPRTTFTLTLAASQQVRVGVYDVLGREVAVLHDGRLSAGIHPFTFEAARGPSGTYLIRAEGAGALQTQAVTLAK